MLCMDSSSEAPIKPIEIKPMVKRKIEVIATAK